MDNTPTARGGIDDDYLRDCARRRLRSATIRYFETALARFTQTTEVADLADFDRDHVRAFQDKAVTLSGDSMRGYLRALRTFSTWLAPNESRSNRSDFTS